VKAKVHLATFVYRDQKNPELRKWLTKAVMQLLKHPNVSELTEETYDDTPIPMTRNRAMADAQNVGADLLLMVDDDVIPDWRLNKKRGPIDRTAKPFLDVALPFVLEHRGPCCVGAPYCGPPPHENIYIFKPANYRSNNPNHDSRVEQYTREEAAQRAGIEEVFALPTGLYLVDMRSVAQLSHPYFDYEYDDIRRIKKATTEDVYFSRNLALVGVPQYVLWDCWAGHIKPIVVDKPDLLTMDMVRDTYRQGILRGQISTEKLIMLGDGEPKTRRPKRKAA
jgi:hypothetical protein